MTEVERLALVGTALTAQVARALREQPEPDRLALTKAEAACSLGVSVDFFEHHIQPELKVVRRGRKVLVPVSAIRCWVDENAERTLDGGAR